MPENKQLDAAHWCPVGPPAHKDEFIEQMLPHRAVACAGKGRREPEPHWWEEGVGVECGTGRLGVGVPLEEGRVGSTAYPWLSGRGPEETVVHRKPTGHCAVRVEYCVGEKTAGRQW